MVNSNRSHFLKKIHELKHLLSEINSNYTHDTYDNFLNPFTNSDLQNDDNDCSDILRIFNTISDHSAYIPLKLKYLYDLRSIDFDKNPKKREILNKVIDFLCFHEKSVLIRHEAAYVIGQMQNKDAHSVLVKILTDSNENEIVRHEAAEALAALGTVDVTDLLQSYAGHEEPSKILQETCILAVASLQEKKFSSEVLEKGDSNNRNSIDRDILVYSENHGELSFQTIDPYFALSTCTDKDTLFLTLSNPDVHIVKRYEALFTLRNMNETKATLMIGEVLLSDKKSALLRHEVAFVLGQLLLLASSPYLISALENKYEHEIVRHEAALSLGSLVSNCIKELLDSENENTEKMDSVQFCLISLEQNLKDGNILVSESCLAALQNIIDEININHY